MKPTQAEFPTVLPTDSLVPLESVLCTGELNLRPRRPPDYEKENRALAVLAQALADSPATVLQILADTILEVLQADSAGISLLTEDEKRFHWPAIAGVWKPHIGGGTPRDFGPCGDVLDRNAPLMFSHFERRYNYFLPVTPPVEECLLVPFYVEGKAVGTVWAIAHDDRRRFDAEDLRQLVSLSRFSSSAYQTLAFHEKTLAINEALVLGSLRQHELTEVAESLNVKLQNEITEREKLEAMLRQSHAELEAAKLQAEQANLGKSRFLAAASHDLRQPLQTMSLLRGILAKSTKDEGTLTLIRKFDQPLQAMSDMLNTLLDINQLEAGIVNPTIVAFPIGPLFDRLKTEFSYYAAAKGLDWRVHGCALHVRSDPRLLEQMLRNLLSNSVKYTSRGKILLGCRRRGGKLRLEVWDTGIGIPAENLQAIFEEYHQLDNPARDRSLGLGLGLAIVQRIGNILGHAIDVRSSSGKGSVFAVEVPLARDRLGIWAPTDAQTSQNAAGTSGTVMIVEDDRMVREMLELLFKVEGHRTVSAADGRKALELTTSGNVEPGIVIADYNLPGGLTGLQAIAEMRVALRREIPAIILTGDISTGTLRKIVHGRCVHLNKPVDAEELTRLVRALLAAQEHLGRATHGGAPDQGSTIPDR